MPAMGGIQKSVPCIRKHEGTHFLGPIPVAQLRIFYKL
jgi:hypothetical protein